ncbi:MAG: GNAT family N-acetyltransferase [Devosia sp.]|uniref:GNAT family N-acetyltransferase n=1 Tax=Devosia sp. TaxID=1871048 RepID=UPI001AC9FCCC|nr:N-acetyltransferase [Devosia sp.]MBN9314515.1 GNAT family N-acetyltransferase [Devosia sp.]
MTVPITIRPATKADASEVALLVNIATHGGIGIGWRHDERAEGTYDPAEVGRLDMLDETSGLNWRNASMAESDGEIVGMLLGYPEPDTMPDTPQTEAFLRPIIELEWLAGGKWFISMLAVHKPWRSKGIGRQLMSLAEQKRAETGRRGLALIVEDENTGARRLYERDGFLVAAARPMHRYPDGTRPGKDWLLMVKDN